MVVGGLAKTGSLNVNIEFLNINSIPYTCDPINFPIPGSKQVAGIVNGQIIVCLGFVLPCFSLDSNGNWQAFPSGPIGTHAAFIFPSFAITPNGTGIYFL